MFFTSSLRKNILFMLPWLFVVFYFYFLTRQFLQYPRWDECQSLLHSHHQVFSYIYGLTKHTPYIQYKGTLTETPHTYAKLSSLFICCCAEPQWADSHKPAVKGKVFFDGKLLDLMWSLPGNFAAAALLHYDMASTKLPQNNTAPFKISHLPSSSEIHSGGLCLCVCVCVWEMESRRE